MNRIMEIANSELSQLNDILRTVNACNNALYLAKEEIPFLQEICEIIITYEGYRFAWVGYIEDEHKTVYPVAQAGFEEGYLSSIMITYSDDEHGRGPTGTSIRTGVTSICRDMINDPRFKPWRAEAIKRGFRSSIALPLVVKEKIIGVSYNLCY